MNLILSYVHPSKSRDQSIPSEALASGSPCSISRRTSGASALLSSATAASASSELCDHTRLPGMWPDPPSHSPPYRTVREASHDALALKYPPHEIAVILEVN